MLQSWPVFRGVANRILSLVLIGGYALAPRPAVASGHQRFTLLDAPTLKKLPPAIRANIAAMVRVGTADGTGVVLDRANGYILTNTHLSQNRPATIRYADGSEAAVHEVLLEDAAHDQAILRVAPPKAPQKIGQARLRDGVVGKGEKVYAVSAVPLLLDQNLVDLGIHRTDPQRFFAAHAHLLNLGESKGATMIALANEMEEFAENRTFATIQTGRETGRGQLSQVLAGGLTIPSVPTNLPNAPGASGSPVFSGRTHELVGLHYAGMPGVTWQSSEISALTVLDEVQRAALDTSLPAATRAALAQLLATQRAGASPP